MCVEFENGKKKLSRLSKSEVRGLYELSSATHGN